MPDYPFEPKSNAYFVPGQFWGVPLSDGRWACGREVLAQGWAHVKSIRLNGQMILGCRDLELDGIRGLREVTHRGGDGDALRGGGPAAARDKLRKRPPCRSCRHGASVISVLAERLFVKHLPLAGQGAGARGHRDSGKPAG